MGHIVNALAFRLGRSVKHKTILSNKLDNRYLMYYQRNLLILQFIKTFFSAYTFTASPENIRKLTEENINENFLKRLMANYFVSKSFLFSHAGIQRGAVLNINVHLYDSGLEKLRTQMYQFVKYAPHTFFKPQKEKRNWANNILNLAKTSKYLHKNKWIRKLKKKPHLSFLVSDISFRPGKSALATYTWWKRENKSSRGGLNHANTLPHAPPWGINFGKKTLNFFQNRLTSSSIQEKLKIYITGAQTRFEWLGSIQQPQCTRQIKWDPWSIWCQKKDSS